MVDEDDDDVVFENSNENDLFENNSNDVITESDEEFILEPKKQKIKKKKALKENFTQEIPSPLDALFEFYKLKKQFEIQIDKNKKKIIINSQLSKREKRQEFLKLMPKCVNCKRPSRIGTLFSITYHDTDDSNGEYRTFKASCGDVSNPCNLNIVVNIGGKQTLDEELNNIQKEIMETKNNIINDKNKLLFGLITTEKAIENFDSNKTYVTEMTSIYEKYLEIWNSVVDNIEKKNELNDTIVQSYDIINEMKQLIQKMNENNDKQFAVDAVNIYNHDLQPLLDKIRNLKYSENIVYNDNNYCKLIQKKYNIDDISISGYTNNVIAYDVGVKIIGSKNKKSTIISEINSKENEPKAFTIKIPSVQDVEDNKLIEDEPIIGKGLDGIDWHTEDYNTLWKNLPSNLRNVFKSNIDWMKEFMNKCVNERKNHGSGWNGCKLTTPPNIVIPPKKMENGEYDFGVAIYNKAFNKQPETIKNTYLTFYKEDPETKEKNYSMLMDAMNRLVENEVNFKRGFF